MTNKDFLNFRVKPLWKLSWNSILEAPTDTDSVKIYGVERGSLDVVKNWEKINSVEQFNQGWVPKPTDFTFTIAVKENGKSFEVLRRLDMSATMFDVNCDILRETGGGKGLDNNAVFETWIKGFENYLGCVINRAGQTVEIGEYPIREFEIMFLRRQIQIIDADGEPTGEYVQEGDGSFPTLESLGIDNILSM